MIVSWEKIRHPHPKEEWKELLRKVDRFEESGGGSSRVLSGIKRLAWMDFAGRTVDGISSYKLRSYSREDKLERGDRDILRSEY
ncbi:hypothetical protein EHQ12_07715 [Leptospira gomenensis]|uniref:Uncharacterized protein n=1 Tax=Leptospira gomenensis TaxID=2484974 RepID=A0A5F1YK19_9LEPT|nr:hypothetical protein [Leptospira gomenensis]TGK34568.1 hypothetical protein EHQ17_09110 [Leptospira gomenensis]TGK40122.1 hypothetical protein EHQ07_18790 [Leptospira gomenensis]TGK40468.1 hypothetical protein EHQ12_07715 [Leptospira gomenensis]TGK55631.1 hypothetical protein EHQ13_17015 [Leptospira gomenensis]